LEPVWELVEGSWSVIGVVAVGAAVHLFQPSHTVQIQDCGDPADDGVRMMLYVACTRAKRSLTLMYTGQGEPA
jgi:hypothetical protein